MVTGAAGGRHTLALVIEVGTLGTGTAIHRCVRHLTGVVISTEGAAGGLTTAQAVVVLQIAWTIFGELACTT